MKRSKANLSRQTLARLDAERRSLGITLERVATEAAKTSRRKRRTVGITTVSNVLAGRTRSANVVATCKRLIAEAKSMTEVA
jgi:hypothetical protein